MSLSQKDRNTHRRWGLLIYGWISVGCLVTLYSIVAACQQYFQQSFR